MGNPIIKDSMTLEQKLDAIQAAVEALQAEEKQKMRVDPTYVPKDPSEALICSGCE